MAPQSTASRLQAVRRSLNSQLYRSVWIGARYYVRYFPRPTVSSKINSRVNKYFWSHPHHFISRTKNGSALEGVTSDDDVQRFVYLYGIWEPGLTQWLSSRLRSGDVFVDVGANVGYFSLLAARCVGPAGRVVAVEASPSIFARLAANIARNNAENVRIMNVAALDHEQRIQVFLGPQGELGLTSIFSDDGFRYEGTVEARQLCTLLSNEDIRRARVIKIDVEGAELLAVKGLVPVISQARDDLEIVVEVGGGPRSAPACALQSAEIDRTLSVFGFHAYRIENRYNPEFYLRYRSARPRRVRDVVDSESDLIFSRVDAELL